LQSSQIQFQERLAAIEDGGLFTGTF
jgi:hypothetical protein